MLLLLMGATILRSKIVSLCALSPRALCAAAGALSRFL
jgi:hypothetical protein